MSWWYNHIKKVAPPRSKMAESKKAKKNFRQQYGKNWERALYATAWKQHKGD
jgi:hypothetical protein